MSVVQWILPQSHLTKQRKANREKNIENDGKLSEWINFLEEKEEEAEANKPCRLCADEKIVYSYGRIGNPETDLPSIKTPKTETANGKAKRDTEIEDRITECSIFVVCKWMEVNTHMREIDRVKIEEEKTNSSTRNEKNNEK